MTPLRLVFVEPKGGGKIQDGVTVTPTKEEQTVEPDSGFDGLGAVKVEAIPDAYQDVSGVNTGAEDIRVGKVGIDAQGNLLNGEMLPRKPEQEKSVVPTKQAQTVSPDSGYALSAVNVAKIPDAYQDVSFVDAEAADIRVGKTGVSATGERLDGQMLPQKPEQTKSVTPTESSQLVEPDSGYALSAVEVDAIPSKYADISGVTAVANVVKSGYVFVDSEGVETQGTNTDDADTSAGTMIASQLEAGEVGYSRGQRIVGTKPIRTTDVEIDSLSPVPIPAGSYDGTVSARLADPTEVDAQYILQGHEILGVQGQATAGADTLEQYFSNTLTEIDDSSATILIADFFNGKTALENVTFRSLTNVGSASFRNCTGLISAALLVVGALSTNLFYGCANLETVNAPVATSIGAQGTFYNCAKLSSLNAPKVETIWITSFYNCKLLHEMVFDGAPTLQKNAYYQSGIERLVFRGDTLATLENVAAFSNTPFASNGTGGTLYVPQNLISQYEQATNWSVILAYPNNQILPIEGSPHEVSA